MLNEVDLRHVAELARVELTEDEVKRFTEQLSSVFDYMDILDEVDVEDVLETSQVTGMANVSEADEIRKGQSTREELLGCTQLPVDSNQVRVLPAIK